MPCIVWRIFYFHRCCDWIIYAEMQQHILPWHTLQTCFKKNKWQKNGFSWKSLCCSAYRVRVPCISWNEATGFSTGNGYINILKLHLIGRHPIEKKSLLNESTSTTTSVHTMYLLFDCECVVYIVNNVCEMWFEFSFNHTTKFDWKAARKQQSMEITCM